MIVVTDSMLTFFLHAVAALYAALCMLLGMECFSRLFHRVFECHEVLMEVCAALVSLVLLFGMTPGLLPPSLMRTPDGFPCGGGNGWETPC